MRGVHTLATSPANDPFTRPFLGRDDELHSLARRLHAPDSPAGQLLFVVGPAGIGKTRLVEEALARGESPARVLWARCPDQPGLPSFWPWARILRILFGDLRDEPLRAALGTEAASAAAIAPFLRGPLDGKDAPRTPGVERLQIFEDLATLLRRAAFGDRIVVVLDDVHWADPTSLEFLAFLASDLPPGLSVVATLRETGAPGSAAPPLELLRLGECIRLAGLARGAVAGLVRHVAGPDVDERAVASIYGVTGGNPFFVGEIGHVLRAGSQPGAFTGDEPLAIPQSVRAVIRSHLEPLGDEPLEVLRMGAAIGHEFDLALVARACGLDPEEALERLAAAAALGLLDELAPSRFAFAHALIRETLYADLGPAARARAHRAAGSALEALAGAATDPPAATLAYHFFRAGPLGEGPRAARWAERAAHQALERCGYPEAADHFRQALEAAELDEPDEARRLPLLLSRGLALSLAAAQERAHDCFRLAASSARALGDTAGLAHAALGYARVSGEIGRVDERAVALLEEAERALGDGDSPLQVSVLGQLAASLYFARDAERRSALSHRAVAMARRLDVPEALAAALLLHHFSRWGPDASPEELLALVDEAEPLALRAAEPRFHLQLLRWRIVDLLELGRIDEAEAALGMLTRSAEDLRLPSYRVHASLVRAGFALLRGDLARAEDVLVTPREALGAARSHLAQGFEIHRLRLRLEQGRAEECLEAVDALRRDLPALPMWSAALALLLTQGDERARERATALVASFDHEALARLPRNGPWAGTLSLLARAAAQLGDADAAGRILPLLEPQVGRHVVHGIGVGYDGPLSLPAGMLASLLGRHDRAAALLADAAATPGAALAGAHAQRALAEVGASAGGPATTAAAPTPGDRDGPRAELLREGESWRVGFAGRVFHLRDTKGLQYLATLLAEPGREFRAVDLAGAHRAGEREAAALGREGLPTRGAQDAGELLDETARRAYRNRLEDLRESLEEAERFGDPGRATLAREEMEALAGELRRAVGLGGRGRKAGSSAERARLNVTRAILAVLRKIAQEDAGLGEHLTATVRTGAFCSYTPDPRRPVSWRV